MSAHQAAVRAGFSLLPPPTALGRGRTACVPAPRAAGGPLPVLARSSPLFPTRRPSPGLSFLGEPTVLDAFPFLAATTFCFNYLFTPSTH